MNQKRLLLGLLLGGSLWGTAAAQSPETDPAAFSRRLTALNARFKGLSTLRSIGKSAGGNDLWLLTLGSGQTDRKPAIVVVANVEGNGLTGTEIALRWAEKLLAAAGTDSIRAMLDRKTFYVLPNMNPDAAAQASARLRYERMGNGSVTDDDRDGRTDEDGPEDLNGDGLITMMRVESPTGTFRSDPTDARVMAAADPAKGQQGRYIYLPEGIDNDRDGQYNEDGPGGIQLNKNFTFDYTPFRPGTGEFAVSEPENRALIDWCYDHKNIYAFFTFGPANNLTEAMKFDPARANARIVKSWLQKDVGVSEQVSKLYTDAGLKDGPTAPMGGGDFPSWAYYHFGKLSFSTPGWWTPRAFQADSSAKKMMGRTGQAAADTARRSNPPAAAPAAAPAADVSAATPGRGPRNGAAPAPANRPAGGPAPDDVQFLKWAATQNMDVFLPWKPIASHPDFPGQKVEIGGLRPFARAMLPEAELDNAAARHLAFMSQFVKLMPDVQIVNVKTEPLGNGVFRVSAMVHNKGLLPTHSDLANRIRYEDRMKVTLTPAANQKILTGRQVQLLRSSLAGNGVEEMTWLVSGPGTLTLEAASGPAGRSTVQVPLK